MDDTIKQLNRILQAGEMAALCVIVSSFGSTPRGPGAEMLVTSKGRLTGTVGGGQAELKCMERAKEAIQQGESAYCEYTHLLSEGEDNSSEKSSGGIRVAILFFSPDKAEHRKLAEELERLTHVRGWLGITYDTDHPQAGAYSEEEKLPENMLAVPVGQESRVYVFGGGHVGQALVPLLHTLHFQVILYDERKEIAELPIFHSCKEIICCEYGRLDEKITFDKRDYVVVMTPEHQKDFLILNEILNKKLTYIGCIGSRKKISMLKTKLMETGYTEEKIQVLHAPIGLPIKAGTAEEVAVSIAAEMILHRSEENGK